LGYAGLVLRAAGRDQMGQRLRTCCLRWTSRPCRAGRTWWMAASISPPPRSKPLGGASNAQFTAEWRHEMTDPIPLSGHGRLVCARVQTERGTAGELQLSANLALPPTLPRPILPGVGGLTLDRFCSIGMRSSPTSNLPAWPWIESLAAVNGARPSLRHQSAAELYQGRFDAQANLTWPRAP